MNRTTIIKSLGLNPINTSRTQRWPRQWNWDRVYKDIDTPQDTIVYDFPILDEEEGIALVVKLVLKHEHTRTSK